MIFVFYAISISRENVVEWTIFHREIQWSVSMDSNGHSVINCKYFEVVIKCKF